MRSFILFLFLLLVSGLVGIQGQAGIKGIPGTAVLGDEVNLSQASNSLMPTIRNLTKIHAPIPGQEKSVFQLEKERATEAFLKLVENEPAVSSARGDAPDPFVLSGFEANPFNSGWPNDNDLAISPSGFIVSTTNTLIRIYDPSGRMLATSTLGTLGGAADRIPGNDFDPRAIYDKDHDRFIVVYDNGSTPGNNTFIIAFSKTGDPTQGWNTYSIDGNLKSSPSQFDAWMDYPQIAITKDELFVSGNQFRAVRNPNPSNPADTITYRAYGSAIWQISLSDGYNANSSLAYTGYRDLALFALSPTEGEPTIEGPEMYFITKGSGAGSGNSFGLYAITGTQSTPGTVFRREASLSASSSYSVPPNARQPNSNNDPNRLLSTNDGRILHAMRVKNNLYGTFACNVNSRPGIYLLKIALSPLGPNFHSTTSTLIASATLDLGFPSITFAGQSCDVNPLISKEDLLIAFNFASPTKFPGHGVYYVDIDGGVSDAVIAIEGRNNLRLTSADGEERNRWGDYSDIATRGNPGEAFIAGYYAKVNTEHTTWISQVLATPEKVCPASSITKEELPVRDFSVYPNPVVEHLSFEFRVEEYGVYKAYVTDMQGRVVKEIIESSQVPGLVELGFNAAVFPAGRYNIVLEGPNKAILSKPFVVLK